DVLVPFLATVLPALFLLGLFTVVRLVETGLESMHFLDGIAHIRGYYRTLGPEAAVHFAPEAGRWPQTASPAVRQGPVLAFFGTTATMVAVINNVVAGAGIALLVRTVNPSASAWIAASAGIAAAVILTFLFYLYQRWRFADFDLRSVHQPG